ncbi:MAG: pyridoxamine kinase [Ruminococcaceae bacterium]|nr:pyridoxamine kinase [Oscillospiraceae bacterium]
MKRILTVQDISCVGKCSLTVALPIISAMGVECSILPTAVLSTHTMFKNFTCRDLTSEIEPVLNHFKKENMEFDALYTGYLASKEQIDLMKKLFADFKTEKNFTFCDPAMADNGKLYAAFDMDFAKHMASLCAKADIIIPNITEASFMTGTEYKENYDEGYIKSLLLKLSDMGSKIVVITGVSFKEGETGAMAYNKEADEFFYYSHKKQIKSYHGTGDIFSSAFIGAMMRGKNYKEAIKIAADFTSECIRLTIEDKSNPWYGVNFEEALPKLIEALK